MKHESHPVGGSRYNLGAVLAFHLGFSVSQGLRRLRLRVRASEQRGGPRSLHNNPPLNVNSHLPELCSEC